MKRVTSFNTVQEQRIENPAGPVYRRIELGKAMGWPVRSRKAWLVLIFCFAILASEREPCAATEPSASPDEAAAAVGPSPSPSELVAQGERALKEKEYAKAVTLFEKAALAGDSNAMYLLGRTYRRGDGIGPDYVKAREWYQKAIDAGNPDDMVGLGVLYNLGQGGRT
jgi:tetratricopeptide (TPR) repeat protein